MKTKASRFVILREGSGGALSTLGPSVDPIADQKEAHTQACTLRDRYPHQTFILAQVIGEYSHVTKAVVVRTTVPEPKKVPSQKRPASVLHMVNPTARKA